MERTVAVIKPGAVSRKNVAEILTAIEKEFNIVDMRMVWMDRFHAEVFYHEHVGKDFFEPLIAHATSGPCVGLLLEAEGAIQKWRDLMGPADHSKQTLSHLRFWFGCATGCDNALHGSDSPAAVDIEAALLGLRGFDGPVPEIVIDDNDTVEEIPQAKFVRLDPAAVLPKRAHDDPGREDVGFDISATADAFLAANGNIVKVPTGWRCQPPRGYELQVRTRSSLGSKGIVVANSPGTIDPAFNGQLFVLLANIGKGDYQVKAGDRIAQLVPRKLDPCECVEVDVTALEDTSRGQAGYGSSGR